MAPLRENRLFSVEMGKGAFCDCGRQAETQFVITSGKGEAKRLAAEAKTARKLGSKAADVCCSLCIAQCIVVKGLFVTELMKYSPIKFDRVTFDVKCADCGRDLSFGTWAHFHAESGQAICVDCGAKRGWSDKSLAVNNVKQLELKAELSALRKRIKIEAQGLSLIEEKVDLCRFAESYNELEKQVLGAVAKLESYLNAVPCGSQEKAILQGLEREVQELHSLASTIKQEIATRLFWLEKVGKKNQIERTSLQDDDDELDKIRQADAAEAEVPA